MTLHGPELRRSFLFAICGRNNRALGTPKRSTFVSILASGDRLPTCRFSD